MIHINVRNKIYTDLYFYKTITVYIIMINRME